MKTNVLIVLPLAALCNAAATPKRQLSGVWNQISSLVQPLLGDGGVDVAGPFAPITTEILKDYLEPVNVSTIGIAVASFNLT